MKAYLILVVQALWAETRRFGGLVGIGIPLGFGMTLGAAMVFGFVEMLLK